MLQLPDGIKFSVNPADGRIVQQHPDEWLWLWRKLGPIKSYLEIGSYDGTGLLALARAGILVPGGTIRVVDICNQGAPGQTLWDAVGELSRDYDISIYRGSSLAQITIDFAGRSAPYEVIFIDGDHSYEAVCADFRNYGKFATRAIVLHDISGSQEGCVRLWRELKGVLRTEEFTAETMPFGDKQGYGIVWK